MAMPPAELRVEEAAVLALQFTAATVAFPEFDPPQPPRPASVRFAANIIRRVLCPGSLAELVPMGDILRTAPRCSMLRSPLRQQIGAAFSGFVRQGMTDKAQRRGPGIGALLTLCVHRCRFPRGAACQRGAPFPSRPPPGASPPERKSD